ncbi:MAG: Trm112 family protein [Acidobacteriota bacterium]
MIERWLHEILVCPESKRPLILFEQDGFLFCPASRLVYRIEDDIPVLLVDEAERVDPARAEELLARALAENLPGSEHWKQESSGD